MVRLSAASVARTAASTGVDPSAVPRRCLRASGSVTDATTRNRRSGVVSTNRAQPGRYESVGKERAGRVDGRLHRRAQAVLHAAATDGKVVAAREGAR